MFYLIDKPIGMTSYDVIRGLKKILHTTRIWHAGTLDPLATWCLLVATHNSTKLLPLLEWSEKSYIFTVNLSGRSASLDLGTEIIPMDISGLKIRTPEEVTTFLLSQKEQIPPKYSAIHIDGQRAYHLARNGEDFVMKPRMIEVKSVNITKYCPPYDITIELRISSGWYIRSFAPLLGEFFGVPWSWYVSYLRRTMIHTREMDLNIAQSIPLESFTIESNISLETLFPSIEHIEIDENLWKDIQNGKHIPNIPNITPNIWQKYFFRYMDFYTSLMEYWLDGYRIIRNDI